MKLVIVESPAKAKTIGKYLGSDYKVDASGGHISDLPEKALGVDVENNFEPEYVVTSSKKALIKRLKDEAKKAEVEQKALRYLMLYIIQERAKSHIKDGKITLEERRSLHHWHSLYHDKDPDGLGGNGDADALMSEVDNLPVDFGE